jgi:hypothetical protein
VRAANVSSSSCGFPAKTARSKPQPSRASMRQQAHPTPPHPTPPHPTLCIASHRMRHARRHDTGTHRGCCSTGWRG